MSWFKHKPCPKNPPKLHAHHSSPIAEKILKETKLEVNKKTEKKKRNE